MGLDMIPAQIAVAQAYVADKLPARKDERGQNSLENAWIIAAVVVVAGIVIAAITAAVNTHVGQIK